MDSSLTDQELDAIESRRARATPAPWTSYWEGRDGDAFASLIMQHLDGQQRDLYLQFDYSPRSETHDLADQDFIAHAREDLPRVLAEVRRLKNLIASHDLTDGVEQRPAGLAGFLSASRPFPGPTAESDS